MRVCGYGRNIKELTGIVLDAWEQDEGGTGGVFSNDGADLLGCEKGGVGRLWLDGDKGLLRCEVVLAELRLDSVLEEVSDLLGSVIDLVLWPFVE